MAAVSELVDQNDTKPDRNSESEVTNEDSSDNTIIGTISGNNTTSNRHELNNSTHQKSAGKNLDSVGKFAAIVLCIAIGSGGAVVWKIRS